MTPVKRTRRPINGHKSGRVAEAATPCTSEISLRESITIHNGYNMRRETVAEYLKRGGKVEKLPELVDRSIDYFTGGKMKPKNGARLVLSELVGTSSYDNNY